ncbi:MAG TPA: cofactor-independent phosphoglycerate mutase [Clostridiales bacterium]|nr:cofactor-independent phosphoglycerate mutase [Clostridiales bacterium]
MKYIVVLGDGMADEPLEELGGKTPLEYANIKNINKLAKQSEIGLCSTIPEGMTPGSDTANLSVLGYDPEKYYTGRSSLEALSLGVDMLETDISFRCNVVTLSEEESDYKDKTIIDHSSGEISTQEATVLIEEVKKHFQNEDYQFYPGTSYRHLTIWNKGEAVDLTAPHDILGKKIGRHLPDDNNLKEMMIKSYEILNNHPININRAKKGLNKANSIWFWGAGTKPSLDMFEEKYGKKGTMISAVDLLKGIAVGSGMDIVEVEGATGSIDTNFEGKTKAALKTLLEDDQDFVYIHLEAPDEMGHQGNVKDKVKAIEYIDEKVVKVLLEELKESGVNFKMLIMPDHPTPIKYRTHTSDPVPYLIYNSEKQLNNSWNYNEKDAKASGNVVETGYKMMNKFL